MTLGTILHEFVTVFVITIMITIKLECSGWTCCFFSFLCLLRMCCRICALGIKVIGSRLKLIALCDHPGLSFSTGRGNSVHKFACRVLLERLLMHYEEMVDNFYKDLRNAIDSTPRHNCLVILGDLNAKISSPMSNILTM